MIITIDGPAASGKTTIARKVACQYGFYYIYSGLLYRALAWLLLQENVEIEQLSKNELACLCDQLQYDFINGKEQINYNGDDIASALSTPRIDEAASILSQFLTVREIINVWQLRLAQQHDVIVDGRDSGSVVFAHADLKFFVDVSIELRAQRWSAKQLLQQRTYAPADAIELLRKRDERDKNRALAPLKIPEKAIILNNSGSLDLAMINIRNYIDAYMRTKDGYEKKAKKIDLGF